MSARRNYFRRWSPASFVLILVATALAAAAPGYKVVNTYKVGGDGGWDYLTADAAARRLYISRATHVIVLDLDSGKNVGEDSGKCCCCKDPGNTKIDQKANGGDSNGGHGGNANGGNANT